MYSIKLKKSILYLFFIIASLSEAIKIGDMSKELYTEAIEKMGPNYQTYIDSITGPGILLEEN